MESEKKQKENTGIFLLESLSNLSSEDAIVEETSEKKYPPPMLQVEDKPSRFALRHPQVLTFDPGRALRELQERQRRLERRIFTFFTMILLGAVGTTLYLQSETFRSTVSKVAKLAASPQPTNCEVSANKSLPECIARRRSNSSTWEGIERAPDGKANHFTLHHNN